MARHVRRSSRRPRLSAAQAEAIRKAFYAATATVEGRFAKGQFVADGDKLYKVVSGGIRYHEDVRTLLYGVAPVARPPKEWKATRTLRATIEEILRDGNQAPNSRALRAGDAGREIPTTASIAKWEDGKPDSLASFPRLEVREEDVIVAVRPIYDDAPIVAWVRDPKLAKAVLAAIEIAPRPHHVTEAHVKMRAPKLET
jgi:hypothetical protein